MRQQRTYGSVRGAISDARPYRDLKSLAYPHRTRRRLGRRDSSRAELQLRQSSRRSGAKAPRGLKVRRRRYYSMDFRNSTLAQIVRL